VSAEIVEAVDLIRLDANRQVAEQTRGEFGQFMTPAPVASLMAGLLETTVRDVTLLDPGAGVGSLAAAAVAELAGRKRKPRSISLTVFEIDDHLASYLPQAVSLCRNVCTQAGINFSADIRQEDFVEWASESLSGGLFDEPAPRFNCAILNPPYRKINSSGRERLQLREAGIETSNLYTAFLALTVKLLKRSGEMVAITPRSFCNGPYFRPFRELLLSSTHLTHVHIFESRKSAFRGDDVLQENIIFRAVTGPPSGVTLIASSRGPDDDDIAIREVMPTQLVQAGDPEKVIHLVPDELQGRVASRIQSFSANLEGLGLTVSTGRVVDFRAKEFLAGRNDDGKPDRPSVPLIYPMHFDGGSITWPRQGKKPNYLLRAAETESLLVPAGTYVLVKRFSAKEERRRVLAAVCTAESLRADAYGFENHLNYYHETGKGLSDDVAYGLAVYLNSSLVDAYFRQFSGHTQVNASDLRKLPYPDRQTLARLGRAAGLQVPPQETIDNFVAKELPDVADNDFDPVAARKRIDEALAILKDLGLPRAQQNDRSALVLLALLDLPSDTAWEDAGSPLMGITPIMDFARDHYGTTYKPNTRETFRRQTMYQFVEAGIAIYNPDKPDRPVNSPKAVYQVTPLLLDVLRTYGEKEWNKQLKDWLGQVVTLKERYAKKRKMAKIPLKLPTGQQIELSPGGQNVLVEQIIHEFCPRFAPGGMPIYVGDTEEKYSFFNKAALTKLGVKIDSHGKMPDVVVHHTPKNWLLLIEAVTSHGPVDGKRHDELKRLFSKSRAPLVFVTTFMNRAAMVKYLGQIAWETEVWVADAPSHMIHFNGERFLGPYK
jgi:adenine-specific DNA-methyltransferase